MKKIVFLLCILTFTCTGCSLFTVVVPVNIENASKYEIEKIPLTVALVMNHESYNLKNRLKFSSFAGSGFTFTVNIASKFHVSVLDTTKNIFHTVTENYDVSKEQIEKENISAFIHIKDVKFDPTAVYNMGFVSSTISSTVDFGFTVSIVDKNGNTIVEKTIKSNASKEYYAMGGYEWGAVVISDVVETAIEDALWQYLVFIYENEKIIRQNNRLEPAYQSN